MKTKGRIHHKWGSEDEFGIHECEFCHKLMRREAITNILLHRGGKGGNGWIWFYSNRGTRWTKEHLPCI